MYSPQHTEDQAAIETVYFSERIGTEKGYAESIRDQKLGDIFGDTRAIIHVDSF